MWRYLKAASIVMLCVAGLLVGGTGTAGADEKCANQPWWANYSGLCLYSDPMFEGHWAYYPVATSNDYTMTDTGWTSCAAFCPSLNDQVSSIWNGSDRFVCLYSDWHYLGSGRCFYPHAYVDYVGDRWNDTFSSLLWD
jgi:hypothetical protein